MRITAIIPENEKAAKVPQKLMNISALIPFPLSLLTVVFLLFILIDWISIGSQKFPQKRQENVNIIEDGGSILFILYIL
jgi:hypothetical protein